MTELMIFIWLIGWLFTAGAIQKITKELIKEKNKIGEVNIFFVKVSLSILTFITWPYTLGSIANK